MKRKYTIGIDGSGIDELLDGLEKFEKWIKTKSQELLNRLASEGFEVASAGFASAQYDGTNDVSVSIEDKGNGAKAIVAVGAAALFIEFGTGINNADDHPEKPGGLAGHGEYGYGLGAMANGWRYPAENGAGTNGVPDEKHPGYIHTTGNPANKPMYEGAKRLKERLPELAQEVFGND